MARLTGLRGLVHRLRSARTKQLGPNDRTRTAGGRCWPGQQRTRRELVASRDPSTHRACAACRQRTETADRALASRARCGRDRARARASRRALPATSADSLTRRERPHGDRRPRRLSPLSRFALCALGLTCDEPADGHARPARDLGRVDFGTTSFLGQHEPAAARVRRCSTGDVR